MDPNKYVLHVQLQSAGVKAEVKNKPNCFSRERVWTGVQSTPLAVLPRSLHMLSSLFPTTVHQRETLRRTWKHSITLRAIS
jgi:hypothetical protein